ncbi:MAG: peptide chain release factor N(5)-glutamine methyltransferase [Candidatus Omnitrophica bacterium]|nr:peptide chain release factor N(5)-glutamine methyltransferase [Candidatus Omnitrophota bacterium]
MNEAELLFTDILNCSRPSLYLDKDTPLDKAQSYFVSGVLKRRIKGEPIQYILGKAEFMGLEFKLAPDVLIPRPETEILVEKTIEMARSPEVAARSILDIGTGSGCIAVSLAKNLPGVEITAVDICEKAIKIARRNALLNNVKINFLKSDLFDNRQLKADNYGIIVSNPPYIPAAEIDALQPEIKYEPRLALDGGKDGLDFYRRIINSAHLYLKENGLLIMEIGFNQKEAVKNIFKVCGYFEIIDEVKDYNNIDRIVIAKKRERTNG